MPVETIADELARQKVVTPLGGRWHGKTVARLLAGKEYRGHRISLGNREGPSRRSQCHRIIIT